MDNILYNIVLWGNMTWGQPANKWLVCERYTVIPTHSFILFQLHRLRHIHTSSTSQTYGNAHTHTHTHTFIEMNTDTNAYTLEKLQLLSQIVGT